MLKKQILIVEDENVVAEDIKKILNNYGYDVVGIIPSGGAAIKSIEKLHPDLILLDIMLNDEISGIDVATSINNMNIPIIYLTAYSDKDIIERARVTGPFGYLIKPFRERELIATIQMAFFKYEMEQELVESEAKFRTLVETTEEGISMFDIEDNFTFINEAGAKIFGGVISDFEDANLLDYLNKFNKEKVYENHNLRKQKKSSRYELEIIRKDGRKRYLNIIGSPRFINNKYVGTFGIFNDITDKKMSQLKLKRTIDSYTRIFENIQDVYYETEFDGTILEISPSIEQDSSYTRKELIGKSIYDLYYNENQHDLFLTKLTKEGHVTDYEIIIVDIDKTLLNCTINAKIIEDDDSGKVRIIGSLKNITEQRESEAACKEYEEKYKMLFNSSIDAVLLLESNCIIDCNAAALKLFGFKNKSELLNLNPAAISPVTQENNKNSHETFEKYIKQTISKGNLKFDWSFTRNNGDPFPVEVWLNHLKYNDRSLIQSTIRKKD